MSNHVSDRRTLRHTLRTAVQVIVALSAGIPSIAAAFHLPAGLVAKVTAALGALVVAVTAAQNGAEASGALPVLLPNPQADANVAVAEITADHGYPAVDENLIDPDKMGGV